MPSVALREGGWYYIIFIMIKSFVKRLSLLIVFTVLVFFLSSCGTQRPQGKSFSYVGVVRQEGPSWVLETDEDKFRIRSTFLDLTPYLNKKVKIHGQFSSEVFFIDDVKPGQ